MESVTSDIQNLQLSSKSQKSSSREPKRRSKRPEIQRYVPKGKILEQQLGDLSGGEPAIETWVDGIDWQKDGSHSPSPVTDIGSPSPRKIDIKNMQVTVVNEKVQSPKDSDQGQRTESVPQHRQQQVKSQSRPERGQQGSKGQGRRSGPKTDINQKGATDKFQENKFETRKTDTIERKNRNDVQTVKDDLEQDPKHELFIVPSRPSTIGQEAQRSSPIVGDDKNEKIDESAPAVIEVHPKPSNLGNTQSLKTKSRSYDKLNKTENWDEEDYYPDPSKLGTLVFERSRSSEQLNLTGKNARPPIPRSASGGASKSPKKFTFSSMRKRTDSFSSDISTGGS